MPLDNRTKCPWLAWSVAASVAGCTSQDVTQVGSGLGLKASVGF